jgi:hypothetical protein
MQEAVARHREFQMRNTEASCSHAKDKADEGGAGVDIFKTTLSPDEVSPLIQKEFQEFTEYPEKHLSQLL